SEFQISMQDNKNEVKNITLDQNYGTLNVNSNPSGMSVSLPELSSISGVTPFSKNITPGAYTVIIQDSLYETYRSIETVNISETTNVEATLNRKTGLLKIYSKPYDSEIFIDGKSVGLAPLTLKNYPTGSYQIEAKKMEYNPKTKTVVLNYNDVKDVDFVLDKGCPPNMGIFDFSELEDGISVYCDNKLLGETPLKYMQTKAGNHKFEFKKKYFESSGNKLHNLNDQQTIRLNYQLSPKSKSKAVLKSFFITGTGQFYSEQKKKGTLFLLIELAGLGYAGYSYADYDTKKKDYEATVDDYLNVMSPEQEVIAWQSMATANKEMSDARDQLATAFLIPIGVHALNFLDALLFGGVPGDVKNSNKQNISLKFKNDKEMLKANLCLNF
ncbi:MAG: PEGA domain-containing protein, partial [Bacteroidota bacterium]|nr:PEGA domain-containing protein [Bacteroidota bacterium]